MAESVEESDLYQVEYDCGCVIEFYLPNKPTEYLDSKTAKIMMGEPLPANSANVKEICEKHIEWMNHERMHRHGAVSDDK